MIAWITMIALFCCEANKYMSHETRTEVLLDDSTHQELKIRFDISMLDLPCSIASVDTVDYYGNERIDIEKDIIKTNLMYDPASDNYIEGDLAITDALERQRLEREEADGNSLPSKKERDERKAEVDKDGHHAYELGAAQFPKWMEQHDISLVNFYAPWCSHCQRLHPVYEVVAADVDKHISDWKHNIKPKLVSVNCVTQAQLCQEVGVRYFPFLVLYKGKDRIEEYMGDRTREQLSKYFLDKAKKLDSLGADEMDGKQQGCRIKGKLTVPRAPGNFHIEAKSLRFDAHASMTNVSHIVNQFEFGVPLVQSYESKLPNTLRYNIRPLHDRKYLTMKPHTSPQHYINVVPTYYAFGATGSSKTPFYQMTAQNRITIHKQREIPAAKFAFTISPVKLFVTQNYTPFYSFATNLCAIIGGTYTMVKILNDIVIGAKELGKME